MCKCEKFNSNQNGAEFNAMSLEMILQQANGQNGNGESLLYTSNIAC